MCAAVLFAVHATTPLGSAYFGPSQCAAGSAAAAAAAVAAVERCDTEMIHELSSCRAQQQARRCQVAVSEQPSRHQEGAERALHRRPTARWNLNAACPRHTLDVAPLETLCLQRASCSVDMKH